MGQRPEDVLGRIRDEGPRRFARWDADLFEAVVAGPAAALRAALGGQPDAAACLAAYLRLAQQGIGAGAVRRARAEAGGWASFLERCLVELVPALLPGVPGGQRVPLLVKVWNLGEGLLREPPWLDRYVTARAAALTDLTRLEDFLMRTLDPVLSPAPPSAWRGPFAVAVLDLRPLNDDFLPGALTLAGPTLLQVSDRRLPDLHAAVLLRAGGRSELLGLMSDLGSYAEPEGPPAVELYDGRVLVGGKVVEVPSLRDCHGYAVARAGFVAACAVDSQRLWIVESP
jgi:hypothetical protein